MIDQKILPTKENGLLGDCLQACIANLLGYKYEQVPHFALFRHAWKEAIDLWLWANDSKLTARLALSKKLNNLDEGQYIAVGDGPRGYRHCIIVDQDLTTIHDPHPSRAGLDSISYVVFFS